MTFASGGASSTDGELGISVKLGFSSAAGPMNLSGPRVEIRVASPVVGNFGGREDVEDTGREEGVVDV